MTRQHVDTFHCHNCLTWVSSETLFGQWLRTRKDMDSKLGHVFTDQDYIVHRYKTASDGRDFQAIMFVEIKTHGAELEEWQRDTFNLINQLLRNRKKTPTKTKLKNQIDGAPQQAYSTWLKRKILLKAFGCHTLRFSGLGPIDSETIIWDKRIVDVETLARLLKFDLDPDTFMETDFRSHHSRQDHPLLPL